eukprot:15011012-Alexandrium_andersonii.AAC.1
MPSGRRAPYLDPAARPNDTVANIQKGLNLHLKEAAARSIPQGRNDRVLLGIGGSRRPRGF